MPDSGSTLDKLNIVIEGSAKDAQDSVDKLIASLKSLKSAAAGVDGASAQAQHGIRNVGAASNEANKEIEGTVVVEGRVAAAASNAARSYKEEASAVGRSARAARESAKSHKELNRQTSKLGNIVSSIKRIAFYRLIRSAIREVTQAVSEGAQIFIEWDRTYNNGMAGAARTADELSAKWRDVKKSIGAAAMPIVQSLQPLLMGLMDTTIKFFEYIQQVVRALRGETHWYHAVYKEAAKTTGQARELQRVLFGFDELNVLPSQTASGVSSEVGAWEYELEELPDTMELVKKGAIGLGAVLGGAGLLGIIKKLIGGVKDKNKNLGEESSQLQADAASAAELVTKLGLAGGAVTLLAKIIKENPFNIGFNVPQLDFSNQQQAIQTMQAWLAENGLEVEIKLKGDPQNAYNTGLGMAAAAQVGAARGLFVNLAPDVSGFSSVLSSLMADAQRNLNNNPLVVRMQVSGETTPASGLGRFNAFSWNAASSALAAQQSKQQSNPYEGMSATDLTNYAESTGLKLTAEDKKALAYTVAGIAGAAGLPALVGAYGAAGAGGLAASLATIFGFASGGMPPMGSLFMAGEAGPEVVSRLNNNRSQVMNTTQMEGAIASGNTGVVSAVYAMANMVVRAIVEKDLSVNLDGQKVSESTTKHQNNAARRYGRPQIIGG